MTHKLAPFILVILALSFLSSGCAAFETDRPENKYRRGFWEAPFYYQQRMTGQYLAETAQMADEDLKLKSLYRKCVEDNYGRPEQIKNSCEPILAPLRISADLNQKSAAQK